MQITCWPIQDSLVTVLDPENDFAFFYPSFPHNIFQGIEVFQHQPVCFKSVKYNKQLPNKKKIRKKKNVTLSQLVLSLLLVN